MTRTSFSAVAPPAAALARSQANPHNEGPLSGLRVMELTTAWAGPMTGRILAFLGAEVIKVESATRPDLWRQHAAPFSARRFPDRKAGERPFNRSGFFNSQNLNKLSLSVDLNAGTDPKPHGNRVRWAAPHDAYRASGEDQWVAIAIASDAQWRQLCDLIDQPLLAVDPQYATFEARWNNQDELREPIEAWTRSCDKFYAAQRLQQLGIRAAPVLDAGEVTRDPHLAWHGFFTPLAQSDCGSHPHASLPFRLSRTPGSQHRASPNLGADTHHVLREIIGMSQSEIESLDRDGVISTTVVRNQ